MVTFRPKQKKFEGDLKIKQENAVLQQLQWFAPA